MGAMENVKEVVALVQKIDNIPLYKQVLELQNEVFALTEENRALKEQLKVREQAEFKDNAYWIREDGPYCSSCLDNAGKLVRLHKLPRYNSPKCPVCGTFAMQPEQPGSSGQRKLTRSNYLSRGGY